MVRAPTRYASIKIHKELTVHKPNVATLGLCHYKPIYVLTTFFYIQDT